MNWNYISGFFDADGYISLAKNKPNEQKTPVLGLTNTKLVILEEIQNFIQKETGIKGIICKKTSKIENHQIGYDLKYVGFSKIEMISKELNSFHPKKKARLNILPTMKLLTPRNGKYSNEILEKRNNLEDLFLSIK